jgi:hypothetical protein
MAFDLAISWIAALATVGMLAAMGMRNRRAGYRKERADIPREIVSLWAAVAAAETQARNVVSLDALVRETDTPAREKPDRTASDLMALGAFTGFGTPVNAVTEQTATVVEQETSQSAAEPVETRQTR